MIDYTNQSKGLVNTSAPPVVLEIQKVHGDKEVLQFLIDDFDLTMEAFCSLEYKDNDRIWAYQRVVSEDLIASVYLADVTDRMGVITRFNHYVMKVVRVSRRSVGRLDREQLGVL